MTTETNMQDGHAETEPAELTAAQQAQEAEQAVVDEVASKIAAAQQNEQTPGGQTDAGSETRPKADEDAADNDGGEKKSPAADAGENDRKQADEQLLRRAGLTAEEIEAMGDAGQRLLAGLRRMRAQADRMAARYGNAVEQIKTLQTDKPTAAEGNAEGGEPPKPPEGEMEEVTAELLDEDPNEALARMMRNQARQQAELQRLRAGGVADPDGTYTIDEQRTIDAFFGELDADVYAEFGAGPVETYSPGDPEVIERAELLAEAEQLRASGKAKDLPDALRRALAVRDPDLWAEAAARRKAAASRAKRDGSQEAPVPRTRVAKAPQDAEADAVDAVAEQIAAAGGVGW